MQQYPMLFPFIPNFLLHIAFVIFHPQEAIGRKRDPQAVWNPLVPASEIWKEFHLDTTIPGLRMWKRLQAPVGQAVYFKFTSFFPHTDSQTFLPLLWEPSLRTWDPNFVVYNMVERISDNRCIVYSKSNVPRWLQYLKVKPRDYVQETFREFQSASSEIRVNIKRNCLSEFWFWNSTKNLWNFRTWEWLHICFGFVLLGFQSGISRSLATCHIPEGGPKLLSKHMYTPKLTNFQWNAFR